MRLQRRSGVVIKLFDLEKGIEVIYQHLVLSRLNMLRSEPMWKREDVNYYGCA